MDVIVLSAVARDGLGMSPADCTFVVTQVGGGALPTVELPTAAVALGATAAVARSLDGALRRGNPPVIGRLVDDRLVLDCRTVLPAQINALAAAISAAAASPG